MGDQLEDIQARLDWALDKLDAIDAERRRFLDRSPYAVVDGDVEPQSGHKVWCLEVRDDAPICLRLLIGEFIHHVRAALDNLTWALAWDATNGSPYDRTQFVVTRSPDEFKRQKRGHLRSLPSGVKDAIESFQPYDGPNAPPPEDHVVWILERLWNEDKHRAPALTGGLATVTSWRFLENVSVPSGAEYAIGPRIYPTVGGFDDGDVVARFPPQNLGYDADMELIVAFDVAFEKAGPGGGRLVMELLRQLYDVVRNDVIPRVASAART